MITFLTAAGLAIEIAAMVMLVLAVRWAKDGYEDETGFHSVVLLSAVGSVLNSLKDLEVRTVWSPGEGI